MSVCTCTCAYIDQGLYRRQRATYIDCTHAPARGQGGGRDPGGLLSRTGAAAETWAYQTIRFTTRIAVSQEHGHQAADSTGMHDRMDIVDIEINIDIGIEIDIEVEVDSW